MPTCYECLRRLPDECICPITPEEKLDRWLDAAKREAELIRALMRGGYKPRVEAYLFREEEGKEEPLRLTARVKCRVESIKVKKKGEFAWKITAKIRMPDDGCFLEVILYDVEDKPLYRRFIMGEFLAADLVEIHWKLEIGEDRT